MLEFARNFAIVWAGTCIVCILVGLGFDLWIRRKG